MMTVDVFSGALDSNSFLLAEGKNCILIDAGCDYAEVEKRLSDLGGKLAAVLLTHGHFDHTISAAKFSGYAPVYISEKDAFMLGSEADSLAFNFGMRFTPVKKYRTIGEGLFNIGGFNVEVIPTPGHTAGSVCYRIGDMLFAGDTVFKYGYGRYDLPTGSYKDLVASFKKLSLYSGLTVFCGHGENTSLDKEKLFNPLFNL